MKTKQIIGLILSLIGGGGAIYFGMAVNNAFKANRFWGGEWNVVELPETEIVLTVIFGIIIVVGIIMIVTGVTLEKTQITISGNAHLCTNCNIKLSPDDKFCPNCGKRVNN